MKIADDADHSKSVQGAWSIDDRCIRCDAARHWGSGLIEMNRVGKSFIARQPASRNEEEQLWRAAIACPTQSIRRQGPKRPAHQVFPYALAPGIMALGHNSRKSFGAHSYLLTRPGGNVMMDSPRFQRVCVEDVAARGGLAHILLSHRDDVADAQRWAEEFGARVWIHAADADAAPFATDIIDAAVTTVASGVVARHAPGHTRGHLVFHVDDWWLFTGDTLHWNHRRSALDVTPKQTWHSWDILADTMDMLAGLKVAGVFPTHGMWRVMGVDSYTEQMRGLGTAMRRDGREAWAQREGTTFGWY